MSNQMDVTLAESVHARKGLLQYLDAGSCEHPNKLLAVAPHAAITYAQGRKLAVNLAGYLMHDLALLQGAVVLVYAINCVEIPSIMAAVQAAGLRVVLRPPSLVPGAVQADARLVKPDAFIVEDEEMCRSIRALGFEQPIITLDGGDGLGKALDEIDGPTTRNDVMDCMADPLQAEIVLFSSGSTGKPKGIVSKLAAFAYNAYYLTEGLGVRASDVIYAPVPIFHCYGMNSVFSTLVRRATWAIMPKYSVESSLEFIERNRATVYFSVPTMLIRELRLEKEMSRVVRTVRVCKVAGDGCPIDVLSEYEERNGCKIILSYGMTETSSTLTVETPRTDKAIRMRSNGPAIEGAQITCDPQTSELLVKSPALTVGILTEEGEVPLAVDEDGWYHTGDIGCVDEMGRVYVSGRIKNIIVRGGANVFPSQIEATYRLYPGVSDCAVVGYPDDELGQRICLVIASTRAEAFSLSDIRAFGRSRLEKGWVPDKVLVVDKLPSLATGKRDNKALKELAHSTPGQGVVA